jgi:hypothetical protein
MTVKEIADRLMTLDSTLWDRLKIESGSKLYSDNDLQKSYIKYWSEYYEGDTSIPTKMKELSMKERNELGDYFEDDNYHALKNLFMLYGYFGMDNKVSAELYYSTSGYGLNPKNFKTEDKKEELLFKVGDEFLGKFDENIYTINIIDESKGDVGFGRYDRKGKNISSNVLNKSIIEDYIKKGYWIKVIDEEKEEQLPFKEGDKFLLTINSGDTTLTILDIDEADVKVQYADGSKGMFELDTAKSRVERGVWKKVIDEEKESGTEEEIKKAIAALEILAEDGDEDAKKGIEALKILLN